MWYRVAKLQLILRVCWFGLIFSNLPANAMEKLDISTIDFQNIKSIKIEKWQVAHGEISPSVRTWSKNHGIGMAPGLWPNSVDRLLVNRRDFLTYWRKVKVPTNQQMSIIFWEGIGTYAVFINGVRAELPGRPSAGSSTRPARP